MEKPKVQENKEHNWFPLCSDINVPYYDTYYWWRCSNCKKETKHIKMVTEEKPSVKGCTALEKNSIFPLSSL